MADPIVITINGEMREKPWTADPTATIEFIRPVLVRHSDGTVIEAGSDDPVSVATDGTFTIPVMPTNDPAWTPVGWTYEVVIFDGQRRYKYQAAVPYDTPGGVMPLPIPALTGSQGVAYAPINHVHSISQITDLQVQLDGKQPAGDYLTADDVDNLVSYETLQEELGDYLPKVQPVVTDSTFTVKRTAGGEARWRATGGALDIDTVGDVIESSFSDPGFTGTQTGLRRLRAGSGNTFAGRTEFGTNVYGSEMFVDPAAGVAALGNKNGLTNVGICGYKGTPGAPIAGTWNTGDVVLATDGIYRCTAGGTPGAWTALLGSATPQPSDHNLNGWTYDPAASVFGTLAQATAGLVRVARVKIMTPVLTNIHFHLTAGGTGLTAGQCFAAAYNDAGALLGPGAVTASLHGTGANGWGDGGFKTHPLNTPMGVTPGAWHRIAWWFNGTTGATFSRASNNGSAIVNCNQTAGQAQYATANAGVTTTAPGNLSGYAGDSTAWFVATS
jgi:hypothetical protein